MTKKDSRQVILDTETTGLNPQDGHRIIEIGCVELVNRRFTNNTFHVYINPDRIIDDGAIKVHGITNEFLLDKPDFKDIVDDYLAFTKDAELIIHNAPFDVGFLNHELALLKDERGEVKDYSTVFDTYSYAKKKYPGSKPTLNFLCRKYGIDISHRELHGALLDAEILAEVYLSMTGGQFSLLDSDEDGGQKAKQEIIRLSADRDKIKVIACAKKEIDLHQKKLDTIKKSSGECVWAQLK